MNLNTGDNTVQNTLPPRNINIKMKIKPYLPKFRNLNIASSGRKDASIFEPSRGGIGIKLKIAKKIFMYIAFLKIPLTRSNVLYPRVSDTIMPLVAFK